MRASIIIFSVAIILVIAGVTVFTRFAPFMIFGRNKRVPSSIAYLGAAMPAAVIAMLILYCLRGTSFAAWPFGIPEGIACVTTAVIHWFGKNTLFSIAGGTILYMALVQLVFV